jgi:hypothetical protein
MTNCKIHGDEFLKGGEYEGIKVGEVAKLGTLQRWIRDCDIDVIRKFINRSSNKNIDNNQMKEDEIKELSLLLLDAVLRVMSNPIDENLTKQWIDSERLLIPTPLIEDNILSRYPLFQVLQSYSSNKVENTSFLPKDASQFSKIISHVAATNRRPPSDYDLNIYSTIKDSIVSDISRDIDKDKDKVIPTRYDIPHVPGAFILTGILSTEECSRFIEAAEKIGYTPDAVDGIDNVVWLADDDMENTIFNRCKSLMPLTIQNCQLKGINKRLRLFRYYPGAVYRPHIDGAWPGSGLDSNGLLTDDLFGDRHSKLTFLIYLNNDFEGKSVYISINLSINLLTILLLMNL